MSQQKVIAVYETTAHAEAAVKTLKFAGYPADDISVKLNQDDAPKVASGELGLWHRLFGRNIEFHGAAACAHTYHGEPWSRCMCRSGRFARSSRY